MANEIFRFVNLRGPRPVPSEPIELLIPLHAPSGEPSSFVADLLQIKNAKKARADFETRARRYVSSNDYALSQHPLRLDVRRVDRWLKRQRKSISTIDLEQGIIETLGRPASEVIASDDYRTTRVRLADSVIALNIAPDSPSDKATVTRWMRIVGLLERLGDLRSNVVDVDAILRLPILLPGDLFPLPPVENPRNAEANKTVEERRKEYRQTEKAVAELAKSIEQKLEAIDELTDALRADTNDLRKPLAAPGPPAQKVPRSVKQGGGTKAAPRAQVLTAVLSTKAAAGLSAATKSVLRDIDVSEDFVDPAYAIATLEEAVGRDSKTLFQGNTSTAIARIGNQWVPITGIKDVVIHDPQWKEPGKCAPVILDVPVATEPTVPATAMNSIRPIGIADLMKVRQAVQGYTLGEVAHIENVMGTETRERTHRQSTRVTETVVVETERINEESRDLQTAERFELQQETNTIIREESSRDVSLSISVSYGPFASGSANINTAHSDSREQSDKNATQYSREVTDRAVKKLQERILERRTVTTEREWEEINKHGFNNTASQDHVQGVYRWVDKIYEAQVISYGLRMIFEIVVPEPAAFYRHALGAMPPEGLRLERPDPPGYCVHPSGTFTPLLPSDLSEGNYQFWISKYGVTGVEPPPPVHKTIGMAMGEQPAENDRFITYTSAELQAPTGYQAERAFVLGDALFWDVQDPTAEFITFHVGRTFLPVNSSGPMNAEDGPIPVAGHGYSVAMVAVTIEVLCLRAKEAFESWRLATYNAIMAAYNDLKSQYDAAIARLEANIQNAVTISGRNPTLNREIEITELKRASLSLLTGQHFDDFDAMRRNVPPHGFPQMDLADAAAEGKYIQFFEQAFEWVNISYRFYPYFWGRKSDWPSYLSLDDADPLFGRFLQAGAARVQVPVRPGFEDAILYFLQTGNRPWEEEDTAFLIEGSFFVSLVEEIKQEQQGAFTKGAGTIAVQHNGTTVTGSNTAFDEALHADRDIIIRDRMYRVVRVMSPTELHLDRGYQDASASAVSYSFGARRVGDPWQLRVPTSLVFLQQNPGLPDLSGS